MSDFLIRRRLVHTALWSALPVLGWANSGAAPLYAVQVPPPIVLRYRLRRGAWSGMGELHWQPRGTRYQAKLEGRVMGIRVLSWSSEGTLDATSGIAPLRFSDQRHGKSLQTATFDRRTRQITYSDASPSVALEVGTQDRLSWMLQIAAIAQADPQRVRTSAHTSFWVSGARGDASVWSFESRGPEKVSTATGQFETIKLVREPRKPQDTRVEVWLDPSRHYLPIRAKLASADGHDALELVLQEPTENNIREQNGQTPNIFAPPLFVGA
jgi:Protein of unknown function (DUF3108)